MKKLILLMTLPLLAFTFTACNNNDDDEDVTYNKFILNGLSYDLTQGEVRFHGEETGYSTPMQLLLYMADNDEIGVYFEMNISKGSNKFAQGIYSLRSDLSAFTYNYGNVAYGLEDDDTSDVTEGKIVVDVTNDIYTIDINCTLENGGIAKGVYKGALNLTYYSN